MRTSIIIFCLVNVSLLSSGQSPRVTIDSGTLEGIIDSSGVTVFRGIPYAAAPVGLFRWREPQPLVKWSGIRKATQYGASCPQPSLEWGPTSEDCLFLNIYTVNEAPQSSSKPKRPVMVWIHGGGYFTGSARGYNGHVLAQKGVVVVTFNYRIGPFGYLDHPALEAESPHKSAGNYGLLDQIAVVKWVQRNIAHFGGDANKVTIFGESAGGFAVGALLASPLANGLFHNAILESGTGIYHGILTRNTARDFAITGAKNLKIDGMDSVAAAELRSIDAEHLMEAYQPPQGSALKPFLCWFAPVVDGWALPLPLDQAIDKGVWNNVPVLVGSNGNEGVHFQRVKPAVTLEDYYNLFGIKGFGDTSGELAQAYAVHDTTEILEQAQNFVGDLGFGAPSRSLARLITTKGGTAYLYYFTRTSKDGNGKNVKAMHTSEIPFVFGQLPETWEPFAHLNGKSSKDVMLANALSDYWVAFASYGNPNRLSPNGKWPPWPVYNLLSDGYLEIGIEIIPKTSLRKIQYDAIDRFLRQKGEIRY